MNAAEHGNHHRPDLQVDITVIRGDGEMQVQIADAGRDGPIPEPVAPDLDAKLAGLQSPRGWGLFLIRQMVDRVEIVTRPDGNTVALTMRMDQSEENEECSS